MSVGVSSWVNIELPYYSKYLLIAAYIASYNPAKSDRKFFAKVYQSLILKTIVLSFGDLLTLERSFETCATF